MTMEMSSRTVPNRKHQLSEWPLSKMSMPMLIGMPQSTPIATTTGPSRAIPKTVEKLKTVLL